ncbi:MAG: hypothetical protein EO766_11755 [Hydrotalea sp. AMD]|uniref:GIY-YIG nuclease family protein n=1 Tax=Hydrotalea sp. AMD TaxID=2501297 RepID=UPI0010285662|nr:GIY-YIG nuclease family protein [Hydrotalea sp. AMD]RWZ87199.1 MAG: hypothetical protein EO766_11755 [Hydrotalea sp. AMD]
MSEAIYIIYKFTSPSGKSYIGQTKHLSRRISGHKDPKSECTALRNAIQKYGFESLTLEILANNLTLDEANTLEQQLILEHNTLAPNGYNLHIGGINFIRSEELKQKLSEHHPRKGKHLSEEHKQNISKSRSGNNRNGISQSPEHIEKRMSAIRGRKHSDETKCKISEHNGSRGKDPWNKGLKLPPQSEETKSKRAKSMKGYNMAYNLGKKWRINPETGKREYYLPD